MKTRTSNSSTANVVTCAARSRLTCCALTIASCQRESPRRGSPFRRLAVSSPKGMRPECKRPEIVRYHRLPLGPAWRADGARRRDGEGTVLEGHSVRNTDPTTLEHQL